MQNSYFPATYQPYLQYQQQSYQPQASSYQTQPVSYQPSGGSGITWVDGVSSARAYPVANGTSILLMDSNESAFYIKSADQSGMPSLRIFDYAERVQNQQSGQPQVAQAPQNQEATAQANAPKIDMSLYVTRDELDQAKKAIEEKIESLSSSAITSSVVQKNGSRK
jgi:hypothetical protein